MKLDQGFKASLSHLSELQAVSGEEEEDKPMSRMEPMKRCKFLGRLSSVVTTLILTALMLSLHTQHWP